LTIFDFPFLADANIHPAVVQHLKGQGIAVNSVHDLGMQSASDKDILKCADNEGHVVLTHDRDFGRLAILSGQPFVGILYLRPGHIDPQFTIDTLNAIEKKPLEVTPPFILVARRRGSLVRLRLRLLPHRP
jgi:predicted nuclease of predicted toxin-antitoxin system